MSPKNSTDPKPEQSADTALRSTSEPFVKHPVVMAQSLSAADNPQEHRPIRSFALRGGHMSEAQKRAYNEGMPRWSVPFQSQTLELSRLFANEQECILEIGFGMGETTAKIAQQMRDKNFLAVEVYTSGVGSLLKLIEQNNLQNIRIVQHDAVEVLQHMIPTHSLLGAHIFFPDPWHKARHHKRRLIQPPFVELLGSRIRQGGYIHCATDWQAYADQMLDVLGASPQLTNTSQNFALKPDYRPLTKFENRGLKLGHGVWDLVFNKR
jgi:tRNA (guanine-N7-)-methyltransferase